jgi:hypothetical protein
MLRRPAVYPASRRIGNAEPWHLARIAAILHVPFTMFLQASLIASGLKCSKARTGAKDSPQLSGQRPLLRIGVTCAAIAIGSAIVGSQLSTTGDLSRAASSAAEEEDAGPVANHEQAASDGEVLDENGGESAEDDAEAAENVAEEPTGAHGDDLAEATEDEPAPEGEAGAAAGEPAEEELEGGNNGWIIGPSSDE